MEEQGQVNWNILSVIVWLPRKQTLRQNLPCRRFVRKGPSCGSKGKKAVSTQSSANAMMKLGSLSELPQGRARRLDLYTWGWPIIEFGYSGKGHDLGQSVKQLSWAETVIKKYCLKAAFSIPKSWGIKFFSPVVESRRCITVTATNCCLGKGVTPQ